MYEEVELVSGTQDLHLGLFVRHAVRRRVADLTDDVTGQQARLERHTVHRHLQRHCTS